MTRSSPRITHKCLIPGSFVFIHNTLLGDYTLRVYVSVFKFSWAFHWTHYSLEAGSSLFYFPSHLKWSTFQLHLQLAVTIKIHKHLTVEVTCVDRCRSRVDKRERRTIHCFNPKYQLSELSSSHLTIIIARNCPMTHYKNIDFCLQIVQMPPQKYTVL